MKDRSIFVLFHKPYGCLSQFTAEDGQKTLSDYELPKDIYAVGRLDKDSEGLLLLTNNGHIQHILSHPKYEHEKAYWVQVEGDIDEQSLETLRKGVQLKNYQTKACNVQKIQPPEILPRVPPIRDRKNIPTSWIEITLTEGKNRQIRRMTAHVGYPTLRLIRIRIEGLHLGSLPIGKWRFVQKEEFTTKQGLWGHLMSTSNQIQQKKRNMPNKKTHRNPSSKSKKQ